MISIAAFLVTHFAATDAFALDSHPPHAFKDDLPQVRHRVTSKNVLIGNVADDSIKAYPRMHLQFHLQQQIRKNLVRIWYMFAFPCPLFYDCPRGDLTWVYFP
eukprot:CAMPEP_0185263020 /NCGR_PEP_ID=MMETSP1359-20130426/11021_1 /TAXON_ID=552665 /ORGANISM="Bigelowiella longifila, Strain CCMP242" /LENGTH=102 /DNA_ID=CAMNT_0027850119 /DNA_START=830 /DNA_END=1134 /DNA_ORIENTATION=-